MLSNITYTIVIELSLLAIFNRFYNLYVNKQMKSMIWIYLESVCFFGILIQFQESTRKNRYEITITSDNKFFQLINYKWSKVKRIRNFEFSSNNRSMSLLFNQ